MSKEGSSGVGNPQDASAADVQTDNPSKNKEIFENRGSKKVIRVVTVMAYLFSVSFVGILLSSYYIFLWKPPNPRLIERGKLRADPQVQFLIDTAPSEKTNFIKKESLFPETEINRASKPLLSPMMYGTYNGDDPDDNSRNKKQERLNAMLLKLRNSLVKIHAKNRNLTKHETVISGKSYNSSVEIEEMVNSSKIMENSISSEFNENVTEGKAPSNNVDPLPKLADSINILDIKSTSASKTTTVHESKRKRKYFNGISVTDANHEDENRNYKSNHNVGKLYPPRKSSEAKTNDDVINDSNQSAVESNDFFKEDQKFSKNNIHDDIKGLIKQDKTDDRQLINGNRKNNSNNMHTIVTLKEHVENLTKHLLPMNVDINSPNLQRNYSNNNEYPSSNYEKYIARKDEVSTVSSSYDSGYIRNNPEFYLPSDEPTAGTRNSEETQIERMTGKFATINNKQQEEMDISTTQRQKDLREILTKMTDIEETSVELTPLSTIQDYRNNFTSILNIDDDDSVT